MPAPRKSSTVHPVPATEAGALAGWFYTCPRCGMEITYSLESMTRIEAAEHLDWHKRSGR